MENIFNNGCLIMAPCKFIPGPCVRHCCERWKLRSKMDPFEIVTFTLIFHARYSARLKHWKGNKEKKYPLFDAMYVKAERVKFRYLNAGKRNCMLFLKQITLI